MADAPAGILGGTAIKPVERHGLEKIKYLIYNKDTGEVCTRTPKSWLLIFIFYVIYYSLLAGFWAAMLTVFFQTLEDGRPKWIAAESIIGTSPGLGLRPLQDFEHIDSSMIRFSKTNADGDAGWKGWAARSDEFLKVYSNTTALKDCTAENPSNEKEACKFDLATLGPCGQDGHGYDQGKPCIFLKLNRIYGLQNTFIDPAAFPEDMPQQLQDHISAQADKEQVWVDCRGEYPADTEALKSIKYYPEARGFPAKYFPYKNQENYKSPLVAVQFETEKIEQLVHIECRAWAQNIGYNRRDRIGIVHLEVMVLP